MSKQLQFVTDASGARVGVLLNMAEYHRLSQNSVVDPEMLVDLSEAELEALAMSQLALSAQARLDKLLEENAKSQLLSDEDIELEKLLEQIDQLTILKTRARYTLYQNQKMIQAAA